MCGISGIVVPPGAPLPRETLRAMNNTLYRRGPDDEGYAFDEAGGCGLGHRRLSIIDLEGGHQPLGNADGSIQVVVNGEIYNFQGIREELLAEGFRFRTNSDSEVVAHGWERWGEGLFERIDGMFALAIWDGRSRRLILARDRMGKKPLYYAFVGPRRQTLVFGSELKALLQHPEFERRVSPGGLALYLTYECLPEDRSIFEGASRVQPGCFMIWDRQTGRTRHGEFWRMRFADSPAADDVRGKTEGELAEHLRGLIREATKARLISDVPLGVLLSGGIDSSTVAAAMADSVPASQIKTFSVTFDDKSFDESSHARKVAKHLGTTHHEERLSPQVMIDILPEVADFMCEPLGDGSLIPTYLLSRFTRQTVTVALGGDGGDELFLGYPTFQADAVARYLDRVTDLATSARLGRVLQRAAGALPVSRKNFSFDFKVKRFAQGIGYHPDFRHQAWMGSFMPHELARVLADDLVKPAFMEDPYATVARFRDRSGARDHYDQAVYQYTRLYLTADVLVKVDRASMAQSLEVRAPLLDTKVVEFACALPGEHKLKGLTTKHLLKEAARRWLPEEIVDRPKKGFGVPIAQWIRGPLRDLAHDLLDPAKLRREGLLNADEVTRLLREHDEGRADHRKPLWTLMALELWMERYGPGTQALHPELRAAG
ncbi:MAG: asparagine synthase (glutamine-hydrolyzing) [Deltaproteobacteria bacterium]|nr:asparagine synthase (glutamine-hydrolyzing) [Deltaproteobacteria bacterium]